MRATPATTRPVRRLLPAVVVVLTAVALAVSLSAASTQDSKDTPANPNLPIPTVATANAPNIITIMADDMRVDDLRFAPNVRRLIGRQGLTFNNSFSPFPLCCPARASFLTGTYAHNHKVYSHRKPYGYASFDDSRTLATSLSQAGYHTAFLGKYLNGYGLDRSKVTGERSYRYVPNGWDDWYGAFENPGVGNFHGDTYDYFDTPYNINGKPTNNRRGQYQTNTLGMFARRIVTANAEKRKPFFVYLSFAAPHFGVPREADDPRPGRDFTRKDAASQPKVFATPARPSWVKGKFDRTVTRAPGFPKGGGPAEADVSDKPEKLRVLTELSAKGRKTLAEVTRQRAEAIFVLDKQVGRLVKTLKKTGAWDNTVLMFTADNGYFLGEHRQRTGKTKSHEPSLRVPFLITGPGMRNGAVRNDPITTVDVAATIIDLAGAVAPHPADGASRLTTMLTGDQGWTVPVVTEATHTTRGKRTDPDFPRGDARTSIGLRTPRYSYTRYDNGEGELYDLYTDPAQMVNLYADPAHTDLRAALDDMWDEYKNCAATECQQPMREQFRATAAEEAVLTAHYWTVIDRVYGP